MSGGKNEQSNLSTTATKGSRAPPAARDTKSSKKDDKKKKSKKSNKSENPRLKSNDLAGIGSQFSAYDSSDPNQRPDTMADSDFF